MLAFCSHPYILFEDLTCAKIKSENFCPRVYTLMIDPLTFRKGRRMGRNTSYFSKMTTKKTSKLRITGTLRKIQFLIAQWLHWLQLFFSRKAVADRLQYMCDRGLSAPAPMLDLFSVSSSDINLKAISWRLFYKRYFNHQSLKLTWKLLIRYFFQI